MKATLICLASVLGITACAVTPETDVAEDRVQFATSLFTGAEQYENFNRLHEIYPVGTLTPAAESLSFSQGAQMVLPPNFKFGGETKDMQAFLKDTDTSAILVLKDGNIVFEDYYLTGGKDVTWMSMSVAKSFVSALVGIAVAEADITSIADPITKYVPELAGSAYDGVSIKDVLQMSSGARWNEDYSDPDSDINRMGGILAVGGSLDDFTATLTSENAPGTVNHYNSADTQALGMLLKRATGRSITDYMTEKLWQPMGAESKAYWLLDDEGMELAFAGMNATARDYAKLGEMYRRGGRLNGKQIVPEEWVSASIKPDGAHVQPDDGGTVYDFGYGYQWWLPQSDEGEFSAIGVYNQFVYVNPKLGVTIVKLSANSSYGLSEKESDNQEVETLEALRAITHATK